MTVTAGKSMKRQLFYISVASLFTLLCPFLKHHFVLVIPFVKYRSLQRSLIFPSRILLSQYVQS